MKQITGWSMILLGLFLLAGALADSKIGSWLRTPAPPATSASLTGIDRVSIRAGTVQLQVASADRPDLGVTVHGGNSDRVAVAFARQGSELQVRVSAPWWHWPRFAEPSAVQVWLPETFNQSLDLNVQTGKVEIRHVRVSTLTYTGQTGSLSAERVQAEEAALRLVTGKIELLQFAGALQADLTTGSLEAQFDALSGPVRVEQVTGKLVMSLPADAGFTVDARAGRGFIQNDLPLAGTAGSSRNVLRGTRGTGTHAVALQLGSGSIIIR